MMNKMIDNTVVSTLSGIMAVKHPVYMRLIREDGTYLARCRGGKGTPKFHWIAGSKDAQGYMKANITIDGKPEYILVHRLVAECFVLNPDPLTKTTVDHKNRIRHDNRKSNLRWATQSEQLENRAVTETTVQKYGVRSCDDMKAYQKAYGKNHKRKRRKRQV